MFYDFRDQGSAETIWSFFIYHAEFSTILVEWNSEINELPGSVSITNTDGILIEELLNQQSVEIGTGELEGLQLDFLLSKVLTL
ncbi:MAG: hypothetical protein EA391_02305 [Balneolaceae bacterium]|nr:MAG: hypothetical protein EA391_02305 [Balneolaceae bacterium]